MGNKAALEILGIQAILTGLGFLLAQVDSMQNGISVVLGAIVSAFNFLTLVFFYECIFKKKRVALGISTVVIKYAILGLLLWGILTQSDLPKEGFIGGVILNPLAVVIFSLFGARRFVSNSSKEK